MKLPFVTISIALYNAEKYIVKCLDSVANQTYKGQLECVIVDDCGTDKSVSIVEDYISSYTGNVVFRIVCHECNQGLSEARNTGIKEAKGDYIYFLDNDDTIIPECVELMAQKIVEHPKSQIVFAGANTSLFRWMDYTTKTLPEYSEDRDWLQTSMLKRYVFSMTTWNKLISTNFIRTNKLQFKKGILHDDEYWNFQLAKHIEFASFVNANTYNYEQYEGGIMKTESYDEGWKRRVDLWFHILEDIDGYNKTNQARGLCTYIFCYNKGKYPDKYKNDIFILLFKAGIRMTTPFNIYTIVQSFFALIKSNKYHNYRLRSKIVIDKSIL